MKHQTCPEYTQRYVNLWKRRSHVHSYPVKVVIDTMEKTIKRIGHMSSNAIVSNIYLDDDCCSDDYGYSFTDDEDNSLNYLYIMLVLAMLIMMILLIKYDQDDKV